MIHLRAPKISDLHDINRIESESFPKPWKPEVFKQIVQFQGDLILDNAIIKMIAAVIDDTIQGYIVWTEGKDIKRGRILNIAVTEERRGQGIGRELLNHAVVSMQRMRIKQVYLEVRESNRTARAFYEKFGFKEKEHIPAYYEDEDAVGYCLFL